MHEGIARRTTRREFLGSDLMRAFVWAVQRESKAEWDETEMNLRLHALALKREGLLGMSNEDRSTRALPVGVIAAAGGG